MKKWGRLILFLVLCFICSKVNASTQLVRVSNIVIEGNKRTQSSIILRELTFKVNDYIDSLNLDNEIKLSKLNIINTSLFLDVDIQYFVEADADMTVMISVRENWYWTILPHFSLADRSFNEWWYERGRDLKRTTIGVDIQHRNFTGSADQLQAYFHFGFTPLQQVSYFEPYLDKKKRLGIRLNFFYGSRNNLPYRTFEDKLEFYNSENSNLRQIGSNGYLRYRKNHNLFHFITYGYSNNQISDSVALKNPEYFGSGFQSLNLFNLGYEFWADFRDVRQYPLNGELLILSVNQYFINQGSNQTNFKLKFNFYRPLSKNIFLENNILAKTSITKSQAYYLHQGLGYSGELIRGYELYVLDGSSYFLNRNSLKFKVYERKFDLSNWIRLRQFSTLPITIFPVAFIDYGYVKNNNAIQSFSKLTNRNLIGGGVGIDLVTFYNAKFNVSYSINQMGERNVFLNFGRYF